MPITTVLAVLGLAVLDMLSPALIAVTLYLLLARPRRMGLLLIVYLVTVAVSYFLLGVVLMLGLGALVPAIDPTVGAWIQGTIGVGLFIASWFIPTKPREGRSPEHPRSFTVRSMVILGLGTWLFEFYTAVPYFGAIAIMTSAGLPAASWLILLGAYVIVMVLPGIVLFIAWALLRSRMTERFERWQRKIETSTGSALSWIIGIAGVLIFLDALPSDLAVVFG